MSNTPLRVQLLSAAESGDLAHFKDLYQSHSPEITTGEAQELLVTAIYNSQISKVEYLLSQSPSMELSDTIIQAAAGVGSIPIFNQLLARDSSIATRQFDRVGTPLTAACSHQAPVKFLEYLLNLGADPNQDPEVTGYPIALVAGLYADVAPTAIDLLLERGARLKHSGALGCAARLGNEASLRYLLGKGATPDTDVRKIGSAGRGDHPLCDALWGGHLGAARILLEYGSSVDVADRNGKSISDIAALLQARGQDRTEFVAMLVRARKERETK